MRKDGLQEHEHIFDSFRDISSKVELKSSLEAVAHVLSVLVLLVRQIPAKVIID